MIGETFDLSIGLSPVNLATAANTGKRVSMSEVYGLTIVLIKGAGTAAEDPVLTLRQHTAATGGTSSDLAAITEYWVKGETTLDGDEAWTRVTQAAAATITDPGAGGVSAETEMLVAIKVHPHQITAGNTHVSLDVADVGAAAQLGCVLYILDVGERPTEPAGYPVPLR